MTSTTDEIRNLRAALDHIRAWCMHEVKNGTPSVEAKGVYDNVRDMAMRGLKTPRASKKVSVSPIQDIQLRMNALAAEDNPFSTP